MVRDDCLEKRGKLEPLDVGPEPVGPAGVTCRAYLELEGVEPTNQTLDLAAP